MDAKRDGMKSPIPSAADELLAFYVESGADAALGEVPVDRFADGAPDASAPPTVGERIGRGTADAGSAFGIESDRPPRRLPSKGAAGKLVASGARSAKRSTGASPSATSTPEST